MERRGQTRLPDYANAYVRHKVRRIRWLPAYRDLEERDLVQELLLEILIRWHKYDPDRAKESTFVVMVVDNRLSQIYEHRQASKRDYRCCAGSLNEKCFDADRREVDRIETITMDEYLDRVRPYNLPLQDLDELRIDIGLVLHRLPTELRRICELLALHEPLEIRQRLGLTKSAYYVRIARLRVIFEDAGLRGYLGRTPQR